MKGIFITFEGGEGAGKTTVLHAIKDILEKQGKRVVATREPGGSEIAEKIRRIILNPDHTEMDARTEALLYAAARRQHLVETVLPQLENGALVLCDRFIDSSLVYQGVGRSLGVDDVLKMNLFATAGLMPALTLYFDVDPAIGLARIEKNSEREFNRLDKEKLDFHYQVREAYQALAKKEPERIKTISAEKAIESVIESTWQLLTEYLTDSPEKSE